MAENPTAIPAKRIRDITQARTVHQDLLRRDEEASRIRAQVRWQLEGGVPTDPAKLKKQGRSHEANANFGHARADFDRARSPFFRLVFDVPRKASVVIHTKPDEPSAEQYQAAAEVAFDAFYDNWGQDAIIEHLAYQADYVAYGVGTKIFDKPKSPRWKCVARGSVRVPRKSKVNTKAVPLVEIDEAFSIADLMDEIKDETTARRAGWNVPLVKRLIAKTIKQGSGGGTVPSKWEEIQDQIRDNDIGCSVPSDTIACVTHLVLERSGKVSKRIFTEDQPNKDGSEGKDGYIFEDEAFADSMDQAIRFGIFEVPLGERGVHGIKGFAVKNYAHSRILNRFKNKLLNSVDVSIGMNFIRRSNDIKEYPVTRFGETINVYNAGLEQIPHWPNIQPAMSLMGYFEQDSARVGGQYHQANAQIAESSTARQATILAGIESQLSQDSAFLFLTQESGTFAEQVRRLRLKDSSDPDAKEFQQFLKDRGVPDEVIFDAKWTVKTAAGAGGAAPWVRQDALARWLQLVSHPNVNDVFILKQAAAQDFGPANIDKAVITDQDPQMLAQARAATQENVDIGQGQPLEALRQDNHSVHIAKHMEVLGAIVSRFQQTGEATPQHAVIGGLLRDHIGQHFEFLSANKNANEVRDRLWNPYAQMAGLVDNLAKAAQEQAAAQPPQLAPA